MSTAAEKTGVTTLDGGPIFPTGLSDREGITLRDWFAAQALNAIVSSDNFWSRMEEARKNAEFDVSRDELAARRSYQFADAMLAERAKAGAA